MNKKKRVGYLYGRPVIEGDENEINAHEILAKKEDGYITLAANNNGLKSISHISSAGENFGDLVLGMGITKNSTVYVYVEEVLNPTTLEDLFFFLKYNSLNGTTITPNNSMPLSYMIAETGGFPFLNSTITAENTWKDQAFIKQYIEDSFSSFSDCTPLSPYHDIQIVPIFSISGGEALCYSFKKGILQGIWTKESQEFTILGIGSLGVGNKCSVVKTNTKKVEVEDIFYIAGDTYVYSQGVIDTDESYIACNNPILFMSPFVNALFVLAVKADTNTPVLVNCMNINTKPLREVFGIPENRVIAAPKEGDYIEYPNVTTTEETTKSRSINRGSSVLVEALQKMVDSLKSEDTINTTETTD